MFVWAATVEFINLLLLANFILFPFHFVPVYAVFFDGSLLVLMISSRSKTWYVSFEIIFYDLSDLTEHVLSLAYECNLYCCTNQHR